MLHFSLPRRPQTAPLTRTALIAGLLLSALALTGPAARADSTAVSFLAPYVQQSLAHGTGADTGVTATVVSLQPGGLTSYTGSAYLGFYNQTVLHKVGNFYTLIHLEGFSGDGAQSFSDRQWGPLDLINPLRGLGYKVTPPSNPGFNFSSFPFNPYAADNLGININALTGTATLTLKSWGSGTITMDLHAQNGLLMGTGYTGGNGTVLITLTPYYYPPIQ